LITLFLSVSDSGERKRGEKMGYESNLGFHSRVRGRIGERRDSDLCFLR